MSIKPLTSGTNPISSSDAFYRSLFENNPLPMWIYDLNTLAFLAVNEAAVKKYGYSREEFLCMTIADIRPTADVPKLMANVQEARPALQHSGEWRHRLKDGTIIDVEITSHTLDFGGGEAVLVVAQDVSERKRAENSVQRLTRLYATLSQINQTIVRVKQRQELFQAICQVAVTSGQFHMAWIGIIAEGPGNLEPVAFDGNEQGFLQLPGQNGSNPPPDETLPDLAIKENKIIICDDVDTDPRMRPWRGEALKRGYRSLAAVPFRAREAVIGVLVLYSSDKGFFGEEERCLLEEISADISFALDSMAIEAESSRAELALIASETRSRVLIENAPDGIALVGPDGTLKYISPSTERILGYTGQETIGKNPAEFTHPDDLPSLLSSLAGLVQGHHHSFTAQYRFRHKDGSWHWIESTVSDLLDEPSVNAIVFNYRDITERRQADEALRDSNERYRTLAEAAQDAIFVVGRDDRIQYLNSFAASLFGLQPKELVSSPRTSLFPAEIAQRQKESLTRIFETGEPLYTEEEAVYQGLKVWQSTSLVPVRNHLGEIQAVLGISRDITHHKQVENALRESQRQMNALVSSLDDIIFEFDEQGTYLNVWTSNDGLLARPRKEFVGRQVAEVLGDDFARPFLEAFRRVLDSGRSETFEYQLDVPDGSRWFQARINAVPASEGPRSTVSMEVRDITESKLAADELQRKTEEAQSRLRKLQALREIDNTIIGSVDLQVSFRAILEQVRSQMGVDAASVLILDPFTLSLDYVAGQGFRTRAFERTHLRMDEGHAGKAVLERRMINIPDLRSRQIDSSRSPSCAQEAFVAYYAVPLIAKGLVKGVMEIFHRSQLNPGAEWIDFLEALSVQAAIAIDNANLFNDLQRSNQELVLAYDATIEGWSRALDLRDKETEGHTQRVTTMTVSLAREMGFDRDEIVHVRRGALLHDIGKMGIPDHILLKPGKLTEEEWTVMRKHPVYAYEMLSPITYLKPALDIPYYHHEKWDGSGYPSGLKGEAIPFAARIFAIVDVWDAVTSDRPYRPAWGRERALDYIREQSGKHFDPRVVPVFLKLIKTNGF